MSARGGSLGCFGVLCLAVQAVASAALVAGLLWLNPAWFDRLAFWRSPRFPPDPIEWSAARPGTAGAEGEDAALLAPTPTPEQLETSREGAVAADYEPASGATLEAADGARLVFPAGALPSAESLSLAPVTFLPQAMAGPVTGPLYELKIGAQEHATFERPVAVTLPFRDELFRESAPVIGVFEAGRWQPLPSIVDRERRRVSAELPHASVLGVLNPAIPAPVAGVLVGGAALAAAGYVVSVTERELLWRGVYAASGCSDEKETAHFVIHSCASGEHVAEPGLVAELAEVLETTFAQLGTVGTPVPSPTFKYRVFVGRTKAYGDTAPGGPLFFNSRLKAILAADDMRPAAGLRSVVAHELVHVAQARFFGTIAAHRYGWWLEASAAYLGDLVWDKQDQPTDMVPQRYVREPQGRLAEKAMDLTQDPDHYGYASFLRFLDEQKPDAGLAFVQAVNAGGDGSLAALDSAARRATGEDLPALFTRWAQAHHHGDLWKGSLAPRLHRGKTPLFAALQQTAENDAGVFAAVVQVRGGRTVVNTWALSTQARLKHLSATAFAMDVGPLDRKAKLVVRVDRLAGASGLELWLASGTLGGTLPGTGASGAFAKLEGDSAVVDGVRNPGGIDRATLLVVNPSLSADVGGVSVDRWLLLPPRSVRFERDDRPRSWTVSWDRVELKDFPQAFRGYDVYRRKAGQPVSAGVKVKEGLTDEIYTDHPEDDETYEYAIKTVDQLGNESEPSESDDDDPFAGDWTGELRLIEGDFARPLMRAVRELADPDGKAGPKTEAQIREIEGLVDRLQHAARMGVPIAFTLRPAAAGYTITVKRFALLEAEGQPSPLDLLGPNTLGPAKWDGSGPPPLLRRTREDEIREDGYSRVEQLGDQQERFTLAWTFHRTRR